MLYRIYSYAIFALRTAGDKLRSRDGRKFTTKDQDNDVSSTDCAEDDNIIGGRWFYNCQESNLNGVYRNGADVGTVKWGHIRPIKKAEMKIKRVLSAS